jgi:hypothetical protein
MVPSRGRKRRQIRNSAKGGMTFLRIVIPLYLFD